MPPKPPTKRQVAAKRKAPTPRSIGQMAAAYRAAWQSPYVQDTLGVRNEAVAMIPIPLEDTDPSGAHTMAAYDPMRRTIFANTEHDPRMYPMGGATPADTPSERNILTHEIGHMYGKSAFPSMQAPLIAPKPTGPLSPREEEARAMLSPYGQTSRNEALAQAYANAAGFLSETAGDTTGFREKLGQYEGNTPGAGSIVRDLLTARPIYQHHPLRGVIR